MGLPEVDISSNVFNFAMDSTDGTMACIELSLIQDGIVEDSMEVVELMLTCSPQIYDCAGDSFSVTITDTTVNGKINMLANIHAA